MQPRKIQNIIAQGEGYFTEFKRNINSDLKKELVAFANASGGNIFPNKIVVSNPGGLLKGMPDKDFGKYSLARNAILANIMQRAGFIEKLGTGITRIKQEVENAGLPKVIFHYNYFFAVEFTRIKKVGKSSQKSSQKILELIKQNSEITISELSEIIGIGDRAIKKQISKLKDSGELRRIGPDKGGYWEIIKNNL